MGSASDPSPARSRWLVLADTGGSFTDCLGVSPSGKLRRAKVLSTGCVRGRVEHVEAHGLRVSADWGDDAAFAPGCVLRSLSGAALARVVGAGPSRLVLDATPASLVPGTLFELTSGEEAPVLGARVLTATPAHSPLPPTELRLATTRATNALLERDIAPTAFFVTSGFADLLRIGDQTRPNLFTLHPTRPDPLHAESFEVVERCAADGTVLTALDEPSLLIHAGEALTSGMRHAAVALLHAWINPSHERRVRELLLNSGFEHVSISSELSPSLGLLARAQTALVNAVLTPTIERYLARVRAGLSPGSSLLIMTSAGSLVTPDALRPKDCLLSGPAGGVVGAAHAGKGAGAPRTLALDMGGTSADASRWDELPPRRDRTRVGDALVLAPCVGVETVAAGGGSICRVHAGELLVGPESARADPGPACYGRGGPLTITDCNLVLGRLDAEWFAIPLDEQAARLAGEAQLALARARIDPSTTLESLLEAFLDIADERMSDAIRQVSVREGADPRAHTLVAFGGAGGQHACAVAEALGIGRVVVPPDASLLSAAGLAHARLEHAARAPVYRPLGECLPTLVPTFERLRRECVDALRAQGVDPAHTEASPTLLVRCEGEPEGLETPASNLALMERVFVERYRALVGAPPASRLEVVEARMMVGDARAPAGLPATEPTGSPAADGSTARARRMHLDARWVDAPLIARERFSGPLDGPALIVERHSTTLVRPGWRGTLDPSGAISLERAPGAPSRRSRDADLARVELAVGRFGAIAIETGELLRRTATSVNVKDRLDFSCAVLSARGELVANAPHVPVHLGSMGVCVRALRDHLGPRLGERVVVTNHPAFGGSHLPDISVVAPAISPDGTLIGYIACRAHHAEIGGISPGSMAPEARSLEQEGVVIPPTMLAPEDEPDMRALERLFERGPCPSRDRVANARDLRSAIRAARWGAEALVSAAETCGEEALAKLMECVLERGATRVRAALRAMPDRTVEREERLDDGAAIRVRVEKHTEHATIDFAGTSGEHPGCLNATPAIVTSAALYVLRLLIDEPLPLNEGLLRPVTLRIPRGLLWPRFDGPGPAVAGGNVETSQRIVDALLSAMAPCAQSQGTMNNVVFGNDRFGFYETLAGGAGAGEGFPGGTAVHTHMTNTRLTDPEVLEARCPVRLESTSIRRGSGGLGAFPGGDGLVRRYRFLEAVRVSVLAERRATAPSGAAGGESGQPGAQWVERQGGSIERLGPAGLDVGAGDTLVVETPGGGGYGPRCTRKSASVRNRS